MSHAPSIPTPSIPIRRDRPPIALAAGLAVSVLVHVAAAWWLGVMPERPPTDRFTPPPATMLPEPDEPQQPRLGMDIPENASIAWLGVLADPIEGVAPESEIDQAALTPLPGEADPVEPTPPQTPPEQVDPVEPEPEPVPEPEPQPEPEPESEPPAQPGDPIILPTDPSDPDLPEVLVTEPIDPREMGPPPPPDDWREQQEAAAREAAEQSDQQADRQADESAEQPPPTPARPPTEGTPGEIDPRAADAAMRRRARELDVNRLGRPLQASGDLRLNTVRPDWSLRVRNAYSPRRNPFVEIRFGPDGRVKLARFVPLPEGTRGSGYDEVDQPLLNAVYAWTAEGEAIEKLKGEGPGATLDIVMRFLLVPSVRGDGEED